MERNEAKKERKRKERKGKVKRREIIFSCKDNFFVQEMVVT
jgi:hypothetical protein